MDARTVVDHFRDEVVDTEEPYLWSDDLVLRYLNEAQTEFTRATEGLEDQMLLSVPAGSTLVTLDRRILKIRSARCGGYSLDLNTPEHTARWRPAVGSPKVLIVRSRTKVEPWPAPATDTVITLDVFRLPKANIEGMSDDLEVDEMHEIGLLHYMMYRAYAKPDPETLDRTKAAFFREEFVGYCRKAQREQGRRRKPTGATQFSW